MEKKETIKAVTFILSGALLQLFNGIGGGWAASVVSIFGLILFFIGLMKLKGGLDTAGKGAVQMLIVGAIIGAVGLFFDLLPIPLTDTLATILFIIAFVFQLIGFIKLKASTTIGEIGKSGAGLLVISMILVIVASVFGFIPLLGETITAILSLVALFLVIFGWIKIQEGIIGEKVTAIKSITFILAGTLLLLCTTATSGWAPAIASIFGLFLLFKGLKQLSDNVDTVGQSAIKLLIISVFIGIAASVFSIIVSIINPSTITDDIFSSVLGGNSPDTFAYILGITFAAAYVVQFIGYLKLKGSSSIGKIGKKGALLLMISMIVVAVGSLIGIDPFAEISVTPIFAIAGLILLFFGWVKIQEGIIEKS